MPYNKTTWADGENKYDIRDQSNNVIHANVKLVYVGTGGTPVSAANMNKIEQGSYDGNLYGSDVGGDDAYVLNLSTTLAEGLQLGLKVATANTGAATLSIDNGVTTKEIRKVTGAGVIALETGDIKANAVVFLAYNGTYWLLIAAGTDATSVGGKVPGTGAGNLAYYDAGGKILEANLPTFGKVASGAQNVPSGTVINAHSALTYTFPIGFSGAKVGVVSIGASNAGQYPYAIIFPQTDTNYKLSQGWHGDGAGHAHRGSTSYTKDAEGVTWWLITGSNIGVGECYISGTNLILKIWNIAGSNYTLSGGWDIVWEVWG